MTEKLSLLAVFAHPDDESCGPGATLALYAHRGVEITLVCVTKGELGAWGADAAIPSEQFGLIRMRELACACRSLGIQQWTVLDYPDGSVAQCPRRELERELVSWIRKVQPQVVVTHYPEGIKGHLDHHTLSLIATRAYFTAGRDEHFPELLTQGLAPWQPLKLYYAMPLDPTLANNSVGHCAYISVDSRCLDAKIRALHCHASQKECWRPVVERIEQSPRWQEAFCLVHSRAARWESYEQDLFASVLEAENYGSN